MDAMLMHPHMHVIGGSPGNQCISTRDKYCATTWSSLDHLHQPRYSWHAVPIPLAVNAQLPGIHGVRLVWDQDGRNHPHQQGENLPARPSSPSIINVRTQI